MDIQGRGMPSLFSSNPSMKCLALEDSNSSGTQHRGGGARGLRFSLKRINK